MDSKRQQTRKKKLFVCGNVIHGMDSWNAKVMISEWYMWIIEDGWDAVH